MSVVPGTLTRVHTVGEFLDTAVEPSEVPRTPVPSGFTELDRCVGGLALGDLWIITGHVGQGRSALATQWAIASAQAGRRTWLIGCREDKGAIAARLRASRVDSLDHLPLHVAANADLTMLDSDDADPGLLRPEVLVVDDAERSAGVFAGRMRTFADRGSCVVTVLPRHLVVHREGDRPCLSHEWASVADVVLEVRQASWPGDLGPTRPGDADFILLRNRRGPALALSVGFVGHRARFFDWGNST